MTATSASLAGRRLAESMMTDTCRIESADSERVWNPDTLSYDQDQEPDEVSYTGPCRVKYGATQPRALDAVGQPVTEQQLQLHLPVLASSDVVVGQIAEVLSSVTDPALVGRRFRISGTFAQTNATARRFPVEEAS